MDVITTRRNSECAKGELSVMIEPKEAYNAPECTHMNVKILSYRETGHTHLTFAGSRERTRLKRPCPVDVVHFSGIEAGNINNMQGNVGKDKPNAVPEMIRSSIGPSSVGGAMLVGVDAPLGVAVRERPKRPRKPIDLEEIEEMVLAGVEGL